MRKAGSLERSILILAAVFLGLAVLFVWIFRDWVRDAIVVPIQYFFWLVGKILNSVDQQILWSVLVVLALAAIANAVLSRSRTPALPIEEDGPTRGQGRVAYWLLYVNLMLKGVYNRSYFSEELKRLILSVIALNERQLPAEVEKQIMNGELDVPPQVRRLYTSPIRRRIPTFSGKIYQAVESIIRPDSGENRPEKLEDLHIVIAFLEEQMERK
jgi:hypothetical protein